LRFGRGALETASLVVGRQRVLAHIGCVERLDQVGRRLLDELHRLRQRVGVAAVEADVVGRVTRGIEADRLGHDKANCFGFRPFAC
jgi:hypothetical protein